MRQYRPFYLIRKIYARAVFRISTDEKVLCITFDDGPNPDSTYKILNILDSYQVKAMFFLTGINVENHPGIKETIIDRGHQIGNHGYLHMSGWSTSYHKYTGNISKAAGLIPSVFYRPPYGRLTPRQYRNLINDYILVFWDLMPYDFSRFHSVGKCLKILKKKIRPGSIIVLHDSPDSKVTGFLAEFIEFAAGQGYSFALPDFTGLGKGRHRKIAC
ncbi:MAG: polysaccharide deacetylase family protein [Bacteroidales bacterium]|nr:polysaccharide deacetylase family protein [Bacteroidales bacterium]